MVTVDPRLSATISRRLPATLFLHFYFGCDRINREMTPTFEAHVVSFLYYIGRAETGAFYYSIGVSCMKALLMVLVVYLS